MSQENCISSNNSDYQAADFTTTFTNDQTANNHNLMYPTSSFYVSSMTSSPTSTLYYDNSQSNQFIQQQNKAHFIQTSSSTNNNTCSPASIMLQDPPMLVASSSSTTTASTISSSSVEVLNEAFAKATSMPESFYPEFLQYSKESYEQSTGNNLNRKKQKRNMNQNTSDNEEDIINMSSTELRRQIHIQSEQKRRAQIKDGFEELRNELPACLNKKMSKVALLHRTVQHIQHLKDTQVSILSELERLVHENEQLRKFQENLIQKQALENMYTMTNM